MTAAEAADRPGPRCADCGVVVERCGFCEREECSDTVCYRCLRIKLRESMAQPHPHGG